MIENIRLAFQGIWGHKMRSVLTMLGIIIGIAAIITIVSTIQGTNEQIKENLIGAGNNVVTVNLNQSGYSYDMGWNAIPDGVRVITEETRQELKNISGVEEVSLYNSRGNSESVYYQNTGFNGETYGIDMHYLSVYGYQGLHPGGLRQLPQGGAGRRQHGLHPVRRGRPRGQVAGGQGRRIHRGGRGCPFQGVHPHH